MLMTACADSINGDATATAWHPGRCDPANCDGMYLGCDRKLFRSREICAPSSVQHQAVPQEFTDLYSQLEEDLDDFISKVDGSTPHPTRFGAGLLPANSNMGYALLRPGTMDTVRQYLDALQSMDVQHVQLDIQFPILTQEFHTTQERDASAFVAFYKNVAQEIHSRNMTLSVESQAIFTADEYSQLPVEDYYASLSFEEYKQGRLETLRIILEELEPEYLTVANEPNTEAMLTGQPELRNVEEYIKMVRFFVEGVQDVKGDTLIGAGLGTWERDWRKLSQAYAATPTIDFINIHIYPINQGLMERALIIGDIAAERDKGIVLGELGLYKMRDTELRALAGEEGSTTIYRRDAYNFWAPLDIKFLKAVEQYSYEYEVLYTSPYWSRMFFAYVPYMEYPDASYSELTQAWNTATMEAIADKELSATGKAYKLMIEE